MISLALELWSLPIILAHLSGPEVWVGNTQVLISMSDVNKNGFEIISHFQLINELYLPEMYVVIYFWRNRAVVSSKAIG